MGDLLFDALSGDMGALTAVWIIFFLPVVLVLAGLSWIKDKIKGK